MIDLSNVTAIALGADEVLQVQDSLGTVLWQKIVNYTVNISAGSNGSVSVNGVTGNYSQSVPEGTILTIQGTGDSGYDFDGWSDGNSDNPRTITVTSDLTLTAAFESAIVYYNVSISAGSNGSVSVNGVTGNYSQSVLAGTSLTIQGIANNDYIFSGWSDGNTTNPRTIVVNSDLTLTSSFKEEPFYVENTNNTAYNVNVCKINSGAPNVTVYYSSDGINWNLMGTTENTSTNAPISISNPANSKMYLKANTDTWSSGGNKAHHIYSSNQYNVGGNIMSLIYGDDYVNKTSFPSGSTANFGYLFTNGQIISANKLKLPATTLTNTCYYNMFSNIYLTTAPATLPATTLTQGCYQEMFKNCRALTTAPTIRATTVSKYSCSSMFENCSALTTAPTLSATTLGDECYYRMFKGCTSLTTAPARLPATTLAKTCYGNMFEGCTSLTTTPALPATNLYGKTTCYGSMFSGCTSLTTAQATLPATTLSQNCYSNMFYNCSALTTAPVIRATSFSGNNCCGSMFRGCTSLTKAPTITCDAPGSSNCFQYMFQGCTNLSDVTVNINNLYPSIYPKAFNNWLDGVSASGTFRNLACGVTYPSGASGIPSGWTEVYSSSDTINVTITNTSNYSGATYQIDSGTVQPINETGTTTFTVPISATNLTIDRNGQGVTDILGVCGITEESEWTAVIPVNKMSNSVTIDLVSLM